MNLRNDEGKLNFVIGLFFTTEERTDGGILVMHKLAYHLADLGHNVYIFVEPDYPHPNIYTIPCKVTVKDNNAMYNWEPFFYPPDKTIAVYPEIMFGHPFSTKYHCKWILHYTPKWIEEKWGRNDGLIFDFNNFYDGKADGKLTVFEYNFDLFHSYNNDRIGYCHILHKYTPDDHESILSRFKSKNITDWRDHGGLGYLNKMFNEHEYFLTFDENSYYTMAAAMSGCIPIVLPTSGKTKHEFRNENLHQRVGVAYGLNDVNWAKSTLPYVHDHLKSIEKENMKTIKNFIQIWKEKTKTT